MSSVAPPAFWFAVILEGPSIVGSMIVMAATTLFARIVFRTA